jgi:hypothetical protein
LREDGPILEQALPHVSRDNVVVAMVQRALVDQKKIRAGAQKAERALAPDVIRILFSFDENWVGGRSEQEELKDPLWERE